MGELQHVVIYQTNHCYEEIKYILGARPAVKKKKKKTDTFLLKFSTNFDPPCNVRWKLCAACDPAQL